MWLSQLLCSVVSAPPFFAISLRSSCILWCRNLRNIPSTLFFSGGNFTRPLNVSWSFWCWTFGTVVDYAAAWMPSSHMGVPGLEFWRCPGIQLPGNVHLGRQQVTAVTAGSLLPKWRPWFLNAASCLALASLLYVLGKWTNRTPFQPLSNKKILICTFQWFSRDVWAVPQL